MGTSRHRIHRLFPPWHLGNDGTLYGMSPIGIHDNGAMPTWSWPVAGAMLWVVAIANFSKHNQVILGAQAYIAAFHMGRVFYHLRLGHHPAAACAPGLFAVFAFIITALRVNVVVAFGGLLACTVVAFILSRILVTPPAADDDEDGQAGANLIHST